MTGRQQGNGSNGDDFDFMRDVIGDDLVIDGVVYDSNVWEADGEGGIERRDRPQD